MIAIGNQFGGPEHKGSPIHRALNLAMRVAAEVRGPNYDDGREPWINPIFIVPGSVSQPDFEGLKLGHFSKAKRGLVVMIALPDSINYDAQPDRHIVPLLREAVQLAAAHFDKNGMTFRTLKAEQILKKIERRLTRA